MRYLDNATVATLLDAPAAVAAMRAGYEEFASGRSAHLPRADLVSGIPAGIHRLGVMAGVSRHHDLAVVRIKSDVVSWSASGREEKYAGEPGLFAGIVLAFRLSDGRPVAILQDGYLQHQRVGAAVALGTDRLAAADALDVALIGSGGMARAFLDALACVRPLRSVTVWSPSGPNRERFAASMTAQLGVPVAPAESAEGAVRGRRLVLTATSATEPTLDPAWLATGAHVTAVSRREVGPALRARADLLACLGASSYPPDAVPGMTMTRGGYAAFLALDAEERARLPAFRESDTPDELPLFERDLPWTTRPADALTVLVAVGTQGIQFACVVGAILAAAEATDAGERLPDGWLLGDIRS